MPDDLGVRVGPEREYQCPRCRKWSEAWRFVVQVKGFVCGTCHGNVLDPYPKKTLGLERYSLSVGKTAEENEP